MFAQRQFILTDIQTKKEYIRKDSASAIKFLDSLANNQFYFTKVNNVKKNGDTIKILFDKGQNYNEAIIKIKPNDENEFQLKSHTKTKNLDSLKQSIHKKFLEKGFPFARISSKYLGMKNNIPLVEISVKKNTQRRIDQFVLKDFNKLPKGFIKNLERDYKNKIYTDKTLSKIGQIFNQNPYISLTKPPQTLFKQDSTQIFLFLSKKKSNFFDGIIGFGNDKSNKISFNGTLDIQFKNLFNSFESVNLYWQKSPDKNQTFNLSVDIPYLLASNLGLDFQTNIYRQDSTYAQVKILPSLYYNLNSSQKLGIRGNFETSSIANSFSQGKNYSKKGIGFWYSFQESTDIPLFIYKSKIRAEIGFLSSIYDKEHTKNSQTDYFLIAERNFPIGGNHYLNAKVESAMQNSKNPLSTNELLRIGGWNSMRGFNENSILSNFYYFGGLEYRYLIGNQAFFDIFGQFGSFENKLLKLKPKIYSLGLGFHFQLPIGLMSFQISNGKQIGNVFKFSDTKIHWGILSRF